MKEIFKKCKKINDFTKMFKNLIICEKLNFDEYGKMNV